MDKQIRNIVKRDVRERKYKRALAVLGVFVMLITAISLKRNGNTLSRKPMCGLKAHEHTGECYNAEGELVCGKEEHIHTDACYQETPTLEDLELDEAGIEEMDISLDGSLELDLSADLVNEDQTLAVVQNGEETAASHNGSVTNDSRERKNGISAVSNSQAEQNDGEVQQPAADVDLPVDDQQPQPAEDDEQSQPANNDQRQPADDGEQLADGQIPIGDGQQPTGDAQKPADDAQRQEPLDEDGQQAADDDGQPADDDRGLDAGSEETERTETQKPAADNTQQPVADDETQQIADDARQEPSDDDVQPAGAYGDADAAIEETEPTLDLEPSLMGQVDQLQAEPDEVPEDTAVDVDQQEPVDDAQQEPSDDDGQALAQDDGDMDATATGETENPDAQEPADDAQQEPSDDDGQAPAQDDGGMDAAATGETENPDAQEPADDAQQESEADEAQPEPAADDAQQEPSDDDGQAPAQDDGGMDAAATGETENPDAQEPADDAQQESEADEAQPEPAADDAQQEPSDDDGQAPAQDDGGMDAAATGETENPDAQEPADDAQIAQRCYMATVDLAEVGTYPISLRGMIANAVPTENAGVSPEDAEAGTGELPVGEWNLEYDRSLFSAEADTDDILITPLVGFESTEIIVDNGSRYELTLINCTLEQPEVEAEPERGIACPAQHFDQSTDYINVVVDAPDGAFPEGTVMVLKDVEDQQTIENIEQSVNRDFVEIKSVHAVDISFWYNDAEIEPMVPISVIMSMLDVEKVQQAQDPVVVHVDNDGSAEVVDSESANKAEAALEMPATCDPSAQAFQADTFSIYAMVFTEKLETEYIDASGKTWSIKLAYTEKADLPEGVKLKVEEVYEQSYLDKAEEAAQEDGKRVAKARFFDIKIMDGDKEVQPKADVQVTVALLGDEGMVPMDTEPTEVGDSDVCAMHFVEENDEIVDVEQKTATEGDDGVSFAARNFSVWGVVYTVDFEYVDPATGERMKWSFPGQGSYRLGTILQLLGIKEEINSAELKLVEGELIEGALYLTTVEGEYYLNSDVPFSDVYELSMIVGGKRYAIRVSDTQTSGDLSHFLTNLVISGVPLQNGEYVVVPNQEYVISLTFKEDSSYQFDSTGTMTYQLPAGVTLPDDISKDIVITINSGNETYEAHATVNVNQNGQIAISFKRDDPNYELLSAATNLTIKTDIVALITQSIHPSEWSVKIDKEITLDETDHSDVYAEKTGSFNEQTGVFTYTIKVKSTGNTRDITVTDIISGDALIFNNDVSMTSNKKGAITVPANTLSSGKGFQYAFESMEEGEEITITYTASLDREWLKGKSKIEYSNTKNTVTVEKEGGNPHTAEYGHEISFKIPDKSNGTESGTDQSGNKIYDWQIEYNKMALISVAGDTVKDSIDPAAQAYMKYYGNVTVKVYDQRGNEIPGKGVTFTPGSDYAWTYTIPDDHTDAYRYVFTYQSVVDQAAVNASGSASIRLKNESEGNGGKDYGEIHVGAGDQVTITKDVQSSSTQEVTWISHIHVPEGGLSKAVVTDTLPEIYLHNNSEHSDWERTFYDNFKEGSLQITGLINGESYTVSVTEDGKVVITFFKDQSKSTEGLQQKQGGHEITVILTTTVDQTWLEYGYGHPGSWEQTHRNTIDINGNQATAEVVFSKPEIKKNLSVNESDKYFMYTIVVSGVDSEPLEIEDSFDTRLLEVATDRAAVWNYFKIFGGNQYSQDYGRYPVSYRDTPNGIVITANSLPKQDNGEYYSHYRITYYLKLKEGIDLEDLAAANGGTVDITNIARWGDHTSTYTFTKEYDFVTKELLKEAREKDLKVKYKIQYNLKKGELNDGEPVEMVDELNAHLSIDYSSIKIVTDPADAHVSYVLKGNDGNTIATYTIPDRTAVTITYDATVTGSGSFSYENTVTVNGKTKKVEKDFQIEASGEGFATILSLKVVKVDGHDASKKLAGVRFRLSSEKNLNLELDKNKPAVYEVILTTDENGVLNISGEDYSLFENEKYYLEEIEPREGYQNNTTRYQFTLTTNPADVNYPKYIYFANDSFQIKNWPLEGLVVRKTVESPLESDHTKAFTFDVSILKEDGTVNDGFNGSYGEMSFENGVANVTLKDGEQASASNMPAGTKFKVEEKNAEGFTVSTTVGETTANGTGYTGVTSADYTLVTFTNKRDVTGSLEVTKHVKLNGNEMPLSEQKTFTVGLYRWNATGNRWDAVQREVNGETVNWTGTIVVAAGQATGKATFAPLEMGRYRVFELDGENMISNNGRYEEYIVSYSDDNGVDITLTDASQSTDVTNNATTTAIEAAKVWMADADTRMTAWPEDIDSVTFTLYKTVNGEESMVTTADVAEIVNPVTVTGDTEEWKASWSGLPTVYRLEAGWYDAAYSVKETAVTYSDGTGKADLPTAEAVEATYGAEWSNTDKTITNKQTTERHATKVWEASATSKLPASVTFTLSAVDSDGKPVELPDAVDTVQTLTKPDGGVWPAAHWTDLPVYTAAGKPITYSVTETAIEGYRPSAPVWNEDTKTWTITNTEVISRTGTKTWANLPTGDATARSATLTLARYKGAVLDTGFGDMGYITVVVDGTVDTPVAASGELTPWNYTWANLEKVYLDAATGAYVDFTYRVTETEFTYGDALTGTTYTVAENDGVYTVKVKDAESTTDAWIVEQNGDDITNTLNRKNVAYGKQWVNPGQTPIAWVTDNASLVPITVALARTRKLATNEQTDTEGATTVSEILLEDQQMTYSANPQTLKIGGHEHTVTWTEGTAENNYVYMFTITGLEKFAYVNGEAMEWTYTLTETGMGNVAGRLFRTSYSGRGKNHADEDDSIIVNIEESVVELPATGGPGTTLIYVAGGAMVLLALLSFILIHRRRREGTGIHSS